MIKTPVTTKVFFFCSPGVKQKKWFTAVLNKYEKAGMQPRNIQEMFLCSSVLIHWYCCHNSCIIAYIGRKMLPREAYILSCYCCYKGIVAKRTETQKGWNLPNPFCKPEWARPLLALIVWRIEFLGTFQWLVVALPAWVLAELNKDYVNPSEMSFKSHLSAAVVYVNTSNLKSCSFLRIVMCLHFDTSLQRHRTAICTVMLVEFWVLFLNPPGKAPLFGPFPLLRGIDEENDFGVVKAKDFTVLGGLYISS